MVGKMGTTYFIRVRVAHSLVFCVVFCESLFVRPLYFPVRFRFTVSQNLTGIFKLFLIMSDKEKRADQYHFHDVTLFMKKTPLISQFIIIIFMCIYVLYRIKFQHII
jgi:hypothetical protein